MAQWTSVITDDVALDVPYDLFALNSVQFTRAVERTLDALFSGNSQVTSFTPSSQNTTIVNISLVFPTPSPGVETLFPTLDVGSASNPNFVASLNQNGLPCAGAFYSDQITASQFNASVAVNASSIGAWTVVDAAEHVTIDVPYASYTLAYNRAFAQAVEVILSLAPNSVEVVNALPAQGGNMTLFEFDILLPYSTDHATVQIVEGTLASVFPLCGAPGSACTAGPGTYFVQNLTANGIPATTAFYNS
jgi:hypothetical protein